MPDHIKNRERLLADLREELVGPAPYGEERDFTGEVAFETSEAAQGPWRQKGTREEVIQWEAPKTRYGVGVLYPVDATRAVDGGQVDESAVAVGLSEGFPAQADELDREDSRAAEIVSPGAREALSAIRTRNDGFADSEALDLTAANTYRPSTMGVTFLAEIPENSRLVVELPAIAESPGRGRIRKSRVNGRYVKKKVMVAGKERAWWLRIPVTLRAEFSASDLRVAHDRKVRPSTVIPDKSDGLNLNVELFSRPRADGETWLITACIVNRTPGDGDESCLFQTHFRAWIEAPEGAGWIHPYPTVVKHDDPEQESLDLLYRNAPTFAVGHGCSADWDAEPGAIRATRVRAECLPTYEAPSITPEILRDDNSPLEVPMAPLAGMDANDDGMAALGEVVNKYAAWIKDQRENVLPSLAPRHVAAAKVHLGHCEACLERMRDGLAYLDQCALARWAFQLANQAILVQQARSRLETRRLEYDRKAKRLVFSAEAREPRLTGKWRPFQIAFLLMSIRSAAEGEAPDRLLVELIWFPTGGGKTEAYLGLAAFSVFARRLFARAKGNGDDPGTHVLMRYTLRLLTTQQFQRAAALLCAMEQMRRGNVAELGESPFSIGIWVGGDNTPNSHKQAVSDLTNLRTQMKKRHRADWVPDNPFVLTRCPWCGAQMGPIRLPHNTPDSVSRVHGYHQKTFVPRGGTESCQTVVFKCTDNRCPFTDGLPVDVIDEAIYANQPTLVIGTVDKFAMLAWRPAARHLFGIDRDGERHASPPGLIIQDELHLISGPLGSMVGLYETLIEELCTDRRAGAEIRPKIVSSTATIRRYQEQIRALYARDEVTLFPPPGLDAGDSFFAKYARNTEGDLRCGRLYVGVHGTGTGSLQTDQVRTFTSLLQSSEGLPSDERDPWWTILVFFNSLRVLGSAVSLFQADIPERFRALRGRMGLDWSQLRRLGNVKELTGRLKNTEIPMALDELAVKYGSAGRPVDVCLASNIIEVGVDIDRLSLMSVVGQPKTTSQYIQVTGRVGRQWATQPGLVVTIYIVSQPRDRSLYEKFRSYHERLYAQVEPTSVTPFSPPALERALHAVLAGYVRQNGNNEVAAHPFPFPVELVEQFRDLVLDRAKRVATSNEKARENEKLLKTVLDRRLSEWRQRKPLNWDGTAGNTPLLRLAGAYASQEQRLFSWPTPMSMRNVDSDCHAEITQLYKVQTASQLADGTSNDEGQN